jgi:uncharacterized protein (DUF433 family)
MTFALEAQPVPGKADADGTVRVAGTRVTLDTIVRAFLRGGSAEEIADSFPAVSLADVYSTISCYLSDRAAVDASRTIRHRSCPRCPC